MRYTRRCDGLTSRYCTQISTPQPFSTSSQSFQFHPSFGDRWRLRGSKCSIHTRVYSWTTEGSLFLGFGASGNTFSINEIHPGIPKASNFCSQSYKMASWNYVLHSSISEKLRVCLGIPAVVTFSQLETVKIPTPFQHMQVKSVSVKLLVVTSYLLARSQCFR
ncbi:hypothetical protein EJ08DRAFT_521102 [Tothia fuscella]|uniref:Uncharacterized protein n=1 Tax=Tothia fuscella TaxID=1048955 RepID=A0A9P4NHI3_9PEZI|nr:hypothetical protein EJ08DRAFT_521102 [Tothia fuscella]